MVSSSMLLPAPEGPSTTRTRSSGTARSRGPSRKDPARVTSPEIVSTDHARLSPAPSISHPEATVRSTRKVASDTTSSNTAAEAESVSPDSRNRL